MRYLCGVFGGIIKGNRGRNIKYFVKEFECILKVWFFGFLNYFYNGRFN